MDATSFWRTPEGDGIGRLKREAKKGREVAAPPAIDLHEAQTPRGWEGPALGGAGVRGCDRAHFESVSAVAGGWREGCRRDWRAHCPAGCEGGISSERDSGDARLNTRPCYVS